mgnify:CR=1 FL=1
MSTKIKYNLSQNVFGCFCLLKFLYSCQTRILHYLYSGASLVDEANEMSSFRTLDCFCVLMFMRVILSILNEPDHSVNDSIKNLSV